MKYDGAFLRVRNLDKYQHYKDRNPPWIKLHQDVLEDYDFARLQDASKAQALCIMLLASRLDNRIPNDPEWIGRRINATDPVDIDALLNAGILEPYCDASESLADCKQSAMPETEGETETEERQSTRASANGFAQFWSAYPKKKNRGDAQRAWQTTRRNRPPVESLLAKIEQLRGTRDWQKEGGQFIPYPATWLRRGGWDDEVGPAAATTLREAGLDDERRAALRTAARKFNPHASEEQKP